MLSNLEKISIFWDESSIYVLVYGFYAICVCIAFLVFEIKLQKGVGGNITKLTLSNAVVAILAILLFAASMLTTGWYANYLGGEIGAFLLTLVITSLVLYLSKVYFIGRYALNYDSSWVPAVTVTTLLLAPYTLFSVLIFLLASGIRN